MNVFWNACYITKTLAGGSESTCKIEANLIHKKTFENIFDEILYRKETCVINILVITSISIISIIEISKQQYNWLNVFWPCVSKKVIILIFY